MQQKAPIASKEVLLVSWKKQKYHVEIFHSLSVFSLSYPRYPYTDLNKLFAFGNTIYEDDDVYIEKKTVVVSPKPDFPRVFFWDFNYDKIHWKANANTIIQRILERGMITHWQELERFYGKPCILQSLKESVTWLPDESIEGASTYFNLKKEEMLCYKRKQSLLLP